MALDDFWKKKATDTSKEQERIAKEQERKDFELISKDEKILFDKYKNIKNFDKAIKGIRYGIKLNSFGRSLYSRILTDLIRKNPRLISLKDLKNQVLQSTKFFKETYITSALDVRHVELRRINGHIVAVMGGIAFQEKIARNSNDKDENTRSIDETTGSIEESAKKINEAAEATQETYETWVRTTITNAIQKYDKTNSLNTLRDGLNQIFGEKDVRNLKECLDKLSNDRETRQQFIDQVIKQRTLSKSVFINLICDNIITKKKNYDLKRVFRDRATDNVHGRYKKRNDNQLKVAKGEEGKTDSKDKGTPHKDLVYLDEKDENLKDYLTSWSMRDTEVGSEGLTLKQAFLLQNKKWLEKLTELTDEELEKKYNEWNNNRLKNIEQVLNNSDLSIYVARKQLEFADFDLTTTQNLGEWRERHPGIDNGEDQQSENIIKFLGYTQGELIGELVMRKDMSTKEGLKLLQTLSMSTAKGSRLFDDYHLTGEWNAETQYFLENALKDPAFQKSDVTGNYSKKILEILNSHPHLDTSYLDQDFQTLSEVQNREVEYLNNPDAFWQSQTIEGPREFVGISDLGNGSSYKLEEQSFLNSHMQEFNGKLAEFLKLPQIREGDSIDDTSRIKMEQIWNTIPLDQINAIYNLFASKPEEQEKFNNFLKENNLPNIDINDVSLKRSVLEQDYSFNPIAKYCYERIWFSCQNEIISESGKTLQYLSDKTGDTALNIKNKVLEFFLPGISIRPEKAENGIFYFRDENNLDTLYSFNPENGEISQQGNISLEDEGIISFRSGGSKGNLLQKIQGFQNIVDIDLLDILPDKNPGNMEELENQILNKIQSKIAVEKVADTSVVNKELLRLKNERNVCYNGIVGDLKQLLNIEDDYLYETSGENYEIFFNLLKTFERIDIEYPNDNKPLNSMKLLLDKICDSTESFTLLKPSLLENNREGDASEEISHENTDGEIEHSQKVSRGPHIIKNLIDPNTQLFDINLINDLAYNGEIDQYLAERKYDRIIAEIQKNKELKIAEQEYEKEVAQLHNSTRDELHGLNEDIELFANISALENEGDFLS